MEALVKEIAAICGKFNEEAEKAVAGNKAAGVRARKASLELEKKLKEFRKESVVK